MKAGAAGIALAGLFGTLLVHDALAASPSERQVAQAMGGDVPLWDQQSSLPPVAADLADVTNLGNTPLAFAYWNGSAWEQAAIEAGAWQTLTCGPCELIEISFHDGTEARTTTIAKGARHRFYWSDTEQRWTIGPF